jgi:hypothetical protein
MKCKSIYCSDCNENVNYCKKCMELYCLKCMELHNGQCKNKCDRCNNTDQVIKCDSGNCGTYLCLDCSNIPKDRCCNDYRLCEKCKNICKYCKSYHQKICINDGSCHTCTINRKKNESNYNL